MERREKDDDCQYCAKCLMAARHPKGDWKAQFRKEVKQHTLILFQMDPAKIDLITHGGRLCKRVKYCFKYGCGRRAVASLQGLGVGRPLLCVRHVLQKSDVVSEVMERVGVVIKHGIRASCKGIERKGGERC